MPTSTVNWLWIGSVPAIDSSPASNVTQTQLNNAAMNGYTAFGPDEIAPVAMTGTTINAGGSRVFTAPFNPGGGGPSAFSFDSPTTAGTISGQTIQSAFRADVSLTRPDGSETNQVATVLQMQNGDLFLRPNANFVSSWDGINSLRSITIDKATPFPNNTVFNSTISFNPNIFDIDIPCFTAGTMIRTPEGHCAVERLRVGDMVMTADHGAQPLRWINLQRLNGGQLAAAPHLCPVRIEAGALGAGCPEADLVVSPQHRVLVRSKIAHRMFEADEVLVAAKHLVSLPGIGFADDLAAVVYVHFLCDRHEVVFANGAPTESLYAGPITMKALGVDAIAEILAIFPDLAQFESFRLSPARTLVKGREGRVMAERHLRNCVTLLAA